MDEKIRLLEARIIDLEKVKDEFYEIKNSIVKMEMVDKSIFDKLQSMNETMKAHKDNFHIHDKNEMEKYGAIDKRLQKIEKIMYMGIGAGLLIELLAKFHLLAIGN